MFSLLLPDVKPRTFLDLFFSYYSVKIFFIYLYVASINVENTPGCVRKFCFLQRVKNVQTVFRFNF